MLPVGASGCSGHIGPCCTAAPLRGRSFSKRTSKRRLYLFKKVKGDDLDITEVQMQCLILSFTLVDDI